MSGGDPTQTPGATDVTPGAAATPDAAPGATPAALPVGPVASPAHREAARAAFASIVAAPGVPKPDPIMVADSVVRRFGGVTAVDVAHLEVQRNSITALIGPNGAGKTTFFNLVTGFDEPEGGTWRFDGRVVSGLPAYRMARTGMVRTFQLTKALAKLTVLDNMRLGATGQRGENMFRALLPSTWRRQEEEVTDRAYALLRRFQLEDKALDYAGSLSGGQRKLLEMARALMATPRMIMLDEPMAGVNPALTQSLLGHVQSLRDDGMTVLFVEHDMDMVRHIADWAVVMAQGAIVAEGPPTTVMADERVIDAYLGSHHDAPLSIEEEEERLAEVVSTGEIPLVQKESDGS